MHTGDNNALKSKSQVNKFSIKLSCSIFLLAMLLFSLGINILKTDVFTHYYNPNRHTVVEQDKDTMAIYAWKDAEGNVYTPNDPEVKYFPYGITALILLLLVMGALSHNVLNRAYKNGAFDKRPIRAGINLQKDV